MSQNLLNKLETGLRVSLSAGTISILSGERILRYIGLGVNTLSLTGLYFVRKRLGKDLFGVPYKDIERAEGEKWVI